MVKGLPEIFRSCLICFGSKVVPGFNQGSQLRCHIGQAISLRFNFGNGACLSKMSRKDAFYLSHISFTPFDTSLIYPIGISFKSD